MSIIKHQDGEEEKTFLSLRKKRPLDMCNKGVEPSSKKRFLDVSKAELDIRKKKNQLQRTRKELMNGL